MLSEAAEGVLEGLALDVIVLIRAEDSQILVVESSLLERGQGSISFNAL